MDEAINRYHTAKGYFQSTIMIFKSPERNSSQRELLTLLSMSLLVGFALELYFKAWLLACGRPSEEVKGLGHRLADLYVEAKGEALFADTLLDELVDAVSKGHQDFTFRYIEDGDQVRLINWSAALQRLDALDTEIDAKVGASGSYGLKPGH